MESPWDMHAFPQLHRDDRSARLRLIPKMLYADAENRREEKDRHNAEWSFGRREH